MLNNASRICATLPSDCHSLCLDLHPGRCTRRHRKPHGLDEAVIEAGVVFRRTLLLRRIGRQDRLGLEAHGKFEVEEGDRDAAAPLADAASAALVVAVAAELKAPCAELAAAFLAASSSTLRRLTAVSSSSVFSVKSWTVVSRLMSSSCAYEAEIQFTGAARTPPLRRSSNSARTSSSAASISA